MSETTEWKTVRIQADLYYKLNELSSLFQLVLGTRLSIGVVNAWAITEYYNNYAPQLRKLIYNIDKIQEIRTKWKTYWENIANLADAKTSREIRQFIELNEDRERDGGHTTTQ